MASTDFSTGGGSPAETIPASDITYTAGAAISTTGEGLFTPGSGTMGGDSVTAFSAASEVGATTVSWDPTIHVALPSSVVAGTYARNPFPVVPVAAGIAAIVLLATAAVLITRSRRMRRVRIS